MNVLHILKTEPDEIVVELMAAVADDQVETVALYQGDVDWDGLVDRIFAADRVICWW
jgi:hypothetical protein